MEMHINIQLFASLSNFTPVSAEKHPIAPGTTVGMLLDQLGVAKDEAKLIFIDGKKGDLTSTLHGGARVDIFPPVGGG